MLTGSRILVVHDDEFTRFQLLFLLGASGAEVRLSKSATEALHTILIWKPDVVLSQTDLPDHGCYRLVYWVRFLDPNIPLLGLTDHFGPEQEVNPSVVGFEKVLVKPFSYYELVKTVAALCRATRGV